MYRNLSNASVALVRILLPMCFLISGDNLLAKPLKLKVTVIENVPTTSSYNWEVAGRSSTSCYGSSCSSYFAPSNAGTSTVQGAVLKLLLPDGHIVVASCAAKQDIAENLANVLTGTVASTVYRSCRKAAAFSTLDADFDGSRVKLFMQEASIDGKGRKYSASYYIAGVLEPTATSEFVAQFNSNPQTEKQLQQNLHEWITSRAAAVESSNDGQALTYGEMMQRVKDGQASILAILTTPSGAEEYVDGMLSSKAPITFILRRRDAPRTITIKMNGYRTYERQFVPDGNDIPLIVKLEQDSPSAMAN